MLEMKIGHLIRQGKIVVCGEDTKKKLKILPDYYNQILTSPDELKVTQGREIVFVGEMSDGERKSWATYMERNKSSW